MGRVRTRELEKKKKPEGMRAKTEPAKSTKQRKEER